MIDRCVKHFLRTRGASPSVYYGGLPRLVFQWTQTSLKLKSGCSFTYDDFANELQRRQLIHEAMSVAELDTVERYKNDIFTCDELVLEHTLCGSRESGGEIIFIANQFWEFCCVPTLKEQRVGSGWPEFTSFTGQAINYESDDRAVAQIPHRSIASEEKAIFIVSHGDVRMRSVAELKMAGLDPDIDLDGDVNSAIETAILFDILADIIDSASEEDRSLSEDGRECYYYANGHRVLMVVFDPVLGGTAFVPLFGRKSFDNWPLPVKVANESP